MVEFLRRLGRFLQSMDAKAITSLAVSVILLIFVVLMFVYGRQWLQLNDDSKVMELMARAEESPWAIIAVISVYSLLALTGFPQVVLIAVTIMAFGPVNGAIYAWIATMTSATLTFGLGHFLGGGWVRRFGGEWVRQTIHFIGHHGILASGLIRVVPSAPFIVVNAAAGAAHIPIWKYWMGTGIGIVPKIMLVALIAALAPDMDVMSDGVSGVVTFFTSREPRDLVLIALVIASWLGFLLLMRWVYRKLRQRDGAY
ncbi:MAG: VTT domain-containing protein [Alphaproteobacteria bacterium]|nr:VTT domain-containing protein [Marinicaulis sp.]NOX95597.1 VTT domain-containing protein [Alphaproteobacteria bacterium]